MPVDPTALLNVAAGSAMNTKSPAKSSLDKDGFLKLMTEQMKNQDPQGQQDPNQYFNTISQMTMVEQLTNLATSSAKSLQSEQTSYAASMIGRSVTYKKPDGTNVTGVLQSVQMGKDEKTGDPVTTVTIGGTPGITVSSILEVA